jgi:hypothetical protein
LVVSLLLTTSCDDLPTAPARTPSMRVRGITLADWTPGGYASAGADGALARIAAAGANTVTLIRTAYQSTLGSSDVVVDPDRTPTIASLSHAATSARSLGLAVVVKPHVDVDTGQWRGGIAPENASRWFASYGDFVLETAAWAETVGAEGFVVGTELAGTVGNEAAWRDLIARVRAVYSGEVVYAATWDGANRLRFWDALDCVGVDFYGAVTARNDPGRVEILAGWQPWIDRLHLLHRQTGKAILLTEIGYRSVDGAGREPFAYGNAAPVDTGEQADLYWAALEALGDQDWIEGVYWWNWRTDGSGGALDRDYTPNEKPAEGELQRAWN